MKKVIWLLFVLFFPLNCQAFELYSGYAILYNLDENTVLYEQNATTPIPIASLTKIMTTIVAIEKITNLDEFVEIPATALEGLREQNAMVIGLKANEQVTFKDLLYASLLPSAADATNSLAILVAGSKENFVTLMNEKASALQLENTHFTDTSGLDDEKNYSTVSDMATVLRYALENPTFYEIFTSQEYMMSNGTLLESTLKYYTTRYALQNTYIKGSKTGYTTPAGYCLASIADDEDTHLLLVTANAPTASRYPYHVVDALTVYDYYFTNYQNKTLYNTDDVLYELPTKYSRESSFKVKAPNSLEKYLANDTDLSTLNFQYSGLETVTPFTPHEQIGTLKVFLEGEELTTIPVMYQGELTFSLWLCFQEYSTYIILGGILLILIGFFIHRKKRRKKSRKRKKGIFDTICDKSLKNG